MDVLSEFFEQHCVFGSTEKATSGAIYTQYKKWCMENGESAKSNIWLGLKLSERPSLCKQRTSSGNVWKGIGLKQQSEMYGVHR